MTIIRRSPIIRVLLPFALGAAAGLQEGRELDYRFLSALCVLVLLVQIYVSGGKLSGIRSLSGSLLAMLLALICGLASGGLARPQDPALPCSANIILGGSVSSVAETREGRRRFDMQVRFLDDGDSIRKIRTRVKVYLPLDGEKAGQLKNPLRAGDRVLIRGRLSAIRNAGNPGEVDYAGIFRRKNTWYRFYADDGFEILPWGSSLSSAGVREQIQQAWTGRERSVALLRAICLGDKTQLDAQVRNDFARSGSMHVLAVSGLHTGLIWWVLNRVLSFLVRISGKEYPRMVLVLLLLWAYAWLTGFSPSVSRAVCMFSLFSLVRLGGRRTTSLNTVLLSMMLLLLVRPDFILDVGFQLSYCAVLSIVGIFPLVSKMWKPRYRLWQWAWEASALSFAAQLGTLPLSIFYFHRIPVYALLSNLVSLPLLSLIVGLFVLSLPWACFPWFASLLGKGLVGLCTLMDRSLVFLASLPGASLEGIGMEGLRAVLLLLLLLCSVVFLSRRRAEPLILVMAVLSVLLVHAAWKEHTLRRSSLLQVSHFRNASLVSVFRGKQADHYLHCSDPRSVSYMDAYIREAWPPSVYEHSVMHLSGRDSLSREGAVSRCTWMGRNCYLLGMREFRLLVLGGSLDERNCHLLSEPALDAILLSGVHIPASFVQKGGWKQVPGITRPLLIADGSIHPFTLGKIKQMDRDVFDTQIQGAFVYTH